MNNDNPLVSVRILTYNSSKYIIETLDSIYAQTYKNIELIISDDGSKDNTVELCNEWLVKHGDRFPNVIVLTVPENTGVCANSSRSLKAVTGKWIKGLGADDCLVPEAIERYVRFVQENRCEVCAAKMTYIDDSSKQLDTKLRGTYNDYISNLKKTQKEQHKLIFKKLLLPGPPLFYSYEVYNKVGGPEEKYGSSDEWAFQLKIMEAGYRVFPLEESLILYRIHSGSLCRPQNTQNTKTPYYVQCARLFMKDELLPRLLHRFRLLSYWDLYIKYKKWGDPRYRYLYLLSPIWYLDKIKSYHNDDEL